MPDNDWTDRSRNDCERTGARLAEDAVFHSPGNGQPGTPPHPGRQRIARALEFHFADVRMPMFARTVSSCRRLVTRSRSVASAFCNLLASAACLAVMPALACDGPDPGPLEQRFKDAAVVAVVRVVSASVSAQVPYVDGQAEVVEVLKGTQGSKVTFRGYLPQVDCWTSIDVGGEYVVFLPNRAEDPSIWIGQFSKTVAAAKVSEALLRQWRAARSAPQ